MTARLLTTEGEPPRPNRAQINEHLYALFAPEFAKDYPDAWIEIAFADMEGDGTPNAAEHFSPFDLEKAAAFAERKNIAGCNVYVGPALRQGVTGPSGRSTADNFLASAYAWADSDDAEGFDRMNGALEAQALPTSLSVMTGRTPHRRAHLYFRFDGKATRDQVKNANVALKKLLGTDDVEDVCRVMRLAGTVSYPTEKKRARGYVTELVTLHIRRDMPCYTVERLTGFAAAASADSGMPGRSDDDLTTLLEKSRTPGQWHNSIRDAIASMIGRSWSDPAIRLSCAPYCKGGSSDSDLDDLINRARKIWHKPDDGKGQQQQRQTGDWDSPDLSLIDDRRGELPELPIDAFPKVMHRWLRDAASGAGVTVGHIALPLIGVASGLVGTARRVQATKSWLTATTCWTCLVGLSGSGKTPSIDVVKRALSVVERGRQQKNTQAQLAHETRQERAKATLKKWKDEVADAIENGQPPPPKPAEAADVRPFVTPRLFVSDCTIERLAPLLEAWPRGVTYIADELARLFQNLERYSGGSDRAFWLEAWDGKSFVVERLGRPSIALSHLLVGIVGGFQPDLLSRCFAGDSDGIYARFLFGWPPEASFGGLVDDVDEVASELLNAFGRLADLQVGEDDAFAPRNVPLTAEARRAFEAFAGFADQEKQSLDGREREYWCKGTAHVLRLAGTLCFLDWAWTGGTEPAAIDALSVESSITLWIDFFWPHGQAALRLVGLSDRHAHARAVLRWLGRKGRTEVSREEVRREALARRLDAGEVQELLDTLVRAGWLREVPAKVSGPGRPPRRWEVNPQVFNIPL